MVHSFFLSQYQLHRNQVHLRLVAPSQNVRPKQNLTIFETERYNED